MANLKISELTAATTSSGVTIPILQGGANKKMDVSLLGLSVAETVVSGSAVTSVVFSDLDGNAAGGYVLVGRVVAAAQASIGLYINSDTTPTNYLTQQIYQQSTTVGGVLRACTTEFTSFNNANEDCHFVMDININSGKIATSTKAIQVISTNTYNVIGGTRYLGADTNITSLTVTGYTINTNTGAANTIGIGSTFSLYKRK